MPLTEKGHEIKNAMIHEYGSKKGQEVLYASKNAGTISGIDKARDAGTQKSSSKESTPGWEGWKAPPAKSSPTGLSSPHESTPGWEGWKPKGDAARDDANEGSTGGETGLAESSNPTEMNSMASPAASAMVKGMSDTKDRAPVHKAFQGDRSLYAKDGKGISAVPEYHRK